MMTGPTEDSAAHALTTALARIGAVMDAEASAAAPGTVPTGSHRSPVDGGPRGRRILQGLVAAAVVVVLGLAVVLAGADRGTSPADLAFTSSAPPPSLELSTRPGFAVTAGPGDDGALCASGGLPDQLGLGQVCTPPETLAIRPTSSASDVDGPGDVLQIVVITAPDRGFQVTFDGETWTTADTDDDRVVIASTDDPAPATAYGFEVQEVGLVGDADNFMARYVDG